MAGLTVAAVRKVIQELITPDMQVIKDRLAGLEGEVKGLHGEFKGLYSEIKRLDDRIDNGLGSVKSEIASVRTELTFTNKRLDEALEIRERLATLEAKVGH